MIPPRSNSQWLNDYISSRSTRGSANPIASGFSPGIDMTGMDTYMPEGVLPFGTADVTALRGERQSAISKWARFVPNLAWNTLAMTAEMPINGILYAMGDKSGIDIPSNIFGQNYSRYSDGSLFKADDLTSWLNGADSLISSAAAFAVPALGISSFFGKMASLMPMIRSMNLANGIAQTAAAGTLAYMEGVQVANSFVRNTEPRLIEEYLKEGLNITDATNKAKQMTSEAADRIVALNTIMNTALNMTMLSPFFRNSKALGRQGLIDDITRIAETEGVTAQEMLQGIRQIGTQNVDDLIKAYRMETGMKFIAESGQETLEEINNQYSEDAGRRLTRKKSSILDDLLNGEEWFKTATSEEGVYSGILGALGGAGQKALIDYIPYSGKPTPKINGSELVRNPDGSIQHEYVRLSNYSREKRGMRAEYINGMDMISNEISKQQQAIAKLTKETDPEERFGILQDIFNVNALRSVEMGYANAWKNTYANIANMSQEDAIANGFAKDENDKNYKYAAERAIEDLDKVQKVYNEYKNKYSVLDDAMGSDYAGYMTHHKLALDRKKELVERYDDRIEYVSKEATENNAYFGPMGSWVSAMNGLYDRQHEMVDEIAILEMAVRSGQITPEAKEIMGKYGIGHSGDELSDAADLRNHIVEGVNRLTTDLNTLSEAMQTDDLSKLGQAIPIVERLTNRKTVDTSELPQAQNNIVARYKLWSDRRLKETGTRPTFREFAQEAVDSGSHSSVMKWHAQLVKDREAVKEEHESSKKQFEKMDSRSSFDGFVKAQRAYQASLDGTAKQAAMDEESKKVAAETQNEELRPQGPIDEMTKEELEKELAYVNKQLSTINGLRKMWYRKRYNNLRNQADKIQRRLTLLKGERTTTTQRNTVPGQAEITQLAALLRSNSEAITENLAGIFSEGVIDALTLEAVRKIFIPNHTFSEVFDELGITSEPLRDMLTVIMNNTAANWLLSKRPDVRYMGLMSLLPQNVRNKIDKEVNSRIAARSTTFNFAVLNDELKSGELDVKDANMVTQTARDYVIYQLHEASKQAAASAEEQQEGEDVIDGNPMEPSSFTPITVWKGRNTANDQILDNLDSQASHFAGQKTKTLHKGNMPTIKYRTAVQTNKAANTVEIEYYAIQQEIIPENIRRLADLKNGQVLYLQIDKDWSGEVKVGTGVNDKMELLPNTRPDSFGMYTNPDGTLKMDDETLENFPIKIVNEKGELVMYYPRTSWGRAKLDGSNNYMNIGYTVSDPEADAEIEYNREIRKRLRDAYNSDTSKSWSMPTAIVSSKAGAFESSKPILNVQWSPGKRVVKLIKDRTIRLMPDPSMKIAIAISQTTLGFGNNVTMEHNRPLVPGAPYAIVKDYNGEQLVIPLSSIQNDAKDIAFALSLVDAYLSANQKHKDAFMSNTGWDITTPAGFRSAFNQFVSFTYGTDITNMFTSHNGVEEDVISILPDGKIQIGYTGSQSTPIVIDPARNKALPASARNLLQQMLEARHKPIKFFEGGLNGVNSGKPYVHPKWIPNAKTGGAFSFADSTKYVDYNMYVKSVTMTAHYGLNQVDMPDGSKRFVYTANPQVPLSPPGSPTFPGMEQQDTLLVSARQEETPEDNLSEEEREFLRQAGLTSNYTAIRQIPDNSMRVTREYLQDLSNLVANNHNGRSVEEVLDALNRKGEEFISRDYNPFRKCP